MSLIHDTKLMQVELDKIARNNTGLKNGTLVAVIDYDKLDVNVYIEHTTKAKKCLVGSFDIRNNEDSVVLAALTLGVYMVCSPEF